MTREEEILKEAKAFADGQCEALIKPDDEYAFEQGARWADKNPINYDGKAMLYVNNKSHENGYKEAVNKACEWLRVELDKEEERHYIHVHGFDKERREIFLEDFKQAMKGE